MSDNICILKKDVQKHLMDVLHILVPNMEECKYYSYPVYSDIVLGKENMSCRATLQFILSNRRINIIYIEFTQDGFHYYKLVDKDYLGISIIHVYYDKFLKHIEKLYSERKGDSND